MTENNAGRPSLLGLIVSGSNVLGVMLIWAIMVLMCVDVISRNAFDQPIAGVSYVVASAVVSVVFLQLASAVRNDRLTRTDFIYVSVTRNYPGLGLAMKVLFHLIGFGICAAIAWYTYPRLVNAWTRSEFVGIIGVMTFPRWPIVAITVYGAGLSAVQFLAKIPGEFREYRAQRNGRTA